MAEKRELKLRVAQIQKDFEEEQEQTFEMRQDMTRQYKGMQEELLSRVSECLRVPLFCRGWLSLSRAQHFMCEWNTPSELFPLNA